MNFKSLLTSLFLITLIVSTAYTQVDKGVFRLGGDLMFDQQKTTIEIPSLGESEFDNSRLMIQLKPGYFVADQFLLGADIGFTSINFDGESSGREFLIGPHISYYLYGGSEGLFFPITAYAGYVTQTTEDSLEPDEEVVSGVYYGGSIGVEYIPGDHWGINLTFGPHFRSYKFETAGFEVEERIANWEVRIGVNYYFSNSNVEE